MSASDHPILTETPDKASGGDTLDARPLPPLQARLLRGPLSPYPPHERFDEAD